MNEKPKYYVVAAVVFDDGEILCVQKPKTKFSYTSFHWEYPGGKVESGESEQEALVRELKEEMDYPIVVDSPLCQADYEYPDFAVNLHFWLCHPANSASPRSFCLKEHTDSIWMKPQQLYTLNWCAADAILPCLFLNQDLIYRDFNCRLIPTVDKSRIIGVRTPVLRAMAKHISCKREDVCRSFLHSSSHYYFEEMQLHAFLLSEMKDFTACVKFLEQFLPHVDNWATCDQLSPRCFARVADSPELLPNYITQCLASPYPYVVRFGMATAMRYYLQDNFSASLMSQIMEYRPAEHFDSKQDIYYVRMMQAWYFATALAFQWDSAFTLLAVGALESTTLKMAIQKAIDSFRVTNSHKSILRKLPRN